MGLILWSLECQSKWFTTSDLAIPTLLRSLCLQLCVWMTHLFSVARELVENMEEGRSHQVWKLKSRPVWEMSWMQDEKDIRCGCNIWSSYLISREWEGIRQLGMNCNPKKHPQPLYDFEDLAFVQLGHCSGFCYKGFYKDCIHPDISCCYVIVLCSLIPRLFVALLAC